MKKATGDCWRYWDRTCQKMCWAANLACQKSRLLVWGQKNRKGAIELADAMGKALGWKKIKPWNNG